MTTRGDQGDRGVSALRASSAVVSYGGGDNSAAMLIGLYEHGERPDAIVFADTGDEKPHTYAHLWEHMQPWCERVGFPSITIVRGEQPRQIQDGSLSAECLRLGALPSKAQGFASCSDKWKGDPSKKWLRRVGLYGSAVRYLGFHADEDQRAAQADTIADPAYASTRYPLIEWGWGPEECRAAHARAGMPSPGKSACFMCPSSKAHEILDLRRRYPDLLERALLIERQAINGEKQAPALHTVKGLGRRFAWRDFLVAADAPELPQPQLDLFAATPERCSNEGCFT